MPISSGQRRRKVAHRDRRERDSGQHLGMTGYAIRSFVPFDQETCAGIFDRAWRAGHPFAPRKIDIAVLATETVGETLFVAEDGSGDVVGFVSLYRPESFVHHLYVEPGLRNRGIGRALLDHAVATAGGSASLKCQLGN